MKTKKSTHPVGKIEKIGSVSNASVLKCTGREWAEWISVLEGFGARQLTHKEIVAELKKKKYKVTVWWQHEVTSGYEIYIGRKLPGRNAKGLFSMTVTKTIPAGQSALWKFLNSEDGQKIWLKPWSQVELVPGAQFEVEDGFFGEVRTVKAPSKLRLTWQDPEWLKAISLQVFVLGRGKDKSMIAIQQEGITTAQIKNDMRARWRAVVDCLAEHFLEK
ncbi:MAG: SRPBCC domain-containing protein [Bdellovibrionales bacterium]|nr:SRPBCC domain-containing protein [Bdellovibrionales bacterium]